MAVKLAIPILRGTPKPSLQPVDRDMRDLQLRIDLMCRKVNYLGTSWTTVLRVYELCFMNPFQGNLLTAAAQIFLPSVLPVNAVTTSAGDPTSQHRQIHVLRTKPTRVPMPTERTAATTAVSGGPIKKKTRVSSWVDINDPMPANPIDVRNFSKRPSRWTTSSGAGADVTAV